MQTLKLETEGDSEVVETPRFHWMILGQAIIRSSDRGDSFLEFS